MTVPDAIGNQATARLLSQRGDASELEAERVSATLGGSEAKISKGAPSPYSLAPELGAGQPLDAAHRVHFEQRLGVGLDGVRVHADPVAAETARSMGAQAYTVGKDIVFAPGRYAPHTGTGEKLLAHELVHVAQGGTDAAIHRNEDVCAAPPNASMPEPAVCMPPPVAKAVLAGPKPIPDSHAAIVSRLAEVQKQLRSVGVVSIETTKELRDEEARLMTALASMQMYASNVPSLLALGNPSLVDWNAGNLRGLAAESTVLKQFYGGGTQLPKNYPGFDFLIDGDRSPMPGLHRGLPLSEDSFFASGGTLVQLKTLKNGEPGYMTNPQSIVNTLKAGMDKMVNKFGPGTARAERIGGEFFRVEHAGDPERMVMHVVLEQEPTAAQAAALAEAAEAGASLKIELIVTAPPKQPLIRMPGPTATAVIGLGVGLLGAYSKGVHAEAVLEEEGYVPPGAGVYESESLIIRLGSIVRGDLLAMHGDMGQLNVPVWRRRMKEACDKKAIGDTIVYTGYNGMERVEITYLKKPDGRWYFVEHDGPKGVIVPDLNLIIDLKVSEEAVTRNLTEDWY